MYLSSFLYLPFYITYLAKKEKYFAYKLLENSDNINQIGSSYRKQHKLLLMHVENITFLLDLQVLGLHLMLRAFLK